MQTLSGLLYYHVVQGRWHRDVKPGNILLRDDGRVKICDFDASKFADATGGQTALGSAFYMSPGTAMNDEGKISSKRDVWSLGVVLAEICLARHPFDDGTSLGEMATRPQEMVNRMPWAEIPADGGLRDLIERCLKVDPDRRISCGDALKHRFFTERVGVRRMIDEAAVAKMNRRGIQIDQFNPDYECETWRAARTATPPQLWLQKDATTPEGQADLVTYDEEEQLARAKLRWTGEIDTVMKRLLYNRSRHEVSELKAVLSALHHKGKQPRRRANPGDGL